MIPFLALWAAVVAEGQAAEGGAEAARSADGALVGFVFRADGTPIAGAAVAAGGVRGVTDAVGGWRLVLPPGTVVVQITAPGFEPAVIADVPVVSRRTTELLLTLGGEAPQVTLETPPDVTAPTSLPVGPPGTLVGVVTEEGGDTPLAGVRIFVRGAEVDATTDRDGRFSLELPSGAWDLSAVRAGYATEAAHVEVVAHEEGPVTLALEKTGLQLSDVTITAPRITGGTASVLDERKESSSVSDVIGAEQMSRSGDSDAASALRRVTGLTVIGGKYVYVRGLGDRYSATLLNGSTLPSPEPEKRVVPLDLFPTSLIEAVVIQKTFSPDRPAEFGGGVVEVRTRSVPEDPVFNIGVTGAWASGTTLSDGQVGPRGPTDWAGFGAGWRALPEEVAAASADEPLKSGGIFSEGGYDADQLETYGEALPNRWGLGARTLPPDFGLTVNAGRSWNVGETTFGALAGLVYGNGWDLEEGVKSVYSSGAEGLIESRRTTFTETSNKIRLGGALSLGLEVADTVSLHSTTLVNRSSVASASTYDADDPTGANDTRTQGSSWVEQQLVFQQFAAGVDLDVVKVDARYAGAVASRREPDRREWVYNLTEEGYVLSQRGSWNDIQYFLLDDVTHDGGLDVTVLVPFLQEGSLLKAGGNVVKRNRASTTRRFGYQFHGSEGIDLTAPIEDVMVPDNIGAEGDGDPGYLQLEENTINSDDYSAHQDLYAAYALGDAAWTPRLRTLAGIRLERSVQTVSTFEIFDTSNEPVEASLGATDWLPAGTVTVGLGPAATPDTMLLRAGYGRTLSRPELRELSEVQYFDNRTGRTLYGNPDLHRATIDNIDLRWEWYPRAGESVSVGGFYKYFDHPIESVVAVSAVSGSVGTFANATSATNYGTEIDFRQRLDVVTDVLSDVYASANVSLIASRVDLSDTDGNQTSDTRPLQGQSPWVVNAQVSYENPDIRTTVALLYNVFGPRIVEVGTSGIPDAYEMPVHRVDLVWTQGLGEHFQARMRGANLLDWPARQKTGDEVSEETRDGWSAGLGLTWTP